MTRFRLICFGLVVAGTALYVLVTRDSSFNYSKITSGRSWIPETSTTRRNLKTMKIFHSIARTHENFTFYKVPPKELYVFSAYQDARYDKMIRFVGMAIHEGHSYLRCLILREGSLETTDATVEFLPEGHNLKFDAVYVLCYSKFPLTPGTSVGLQFDGTDAKPFLMPLQFVPKAPISSSKGLTVCYPPLHTNFDDVDMFVENIELNRILGFRKFFVYVHKVGARVRRAINSYVRDGVISVISWEKFPLVSGNKYPVPRDYTIHYLGQMVAINDCLYRAMNQPFRVVAFHDFDEVIIPHAGRSLIDVVKKEMGPSVSGLSVRCAMFSTLYENDAEVARNWTKDSPRLWTQLKTKRLPRILPHRERSKMLVAADKVITMGIHFVWRFFSDRPKHLEQNTVLLHHYRAWGNSPGVVDRTALQFQPELLANVNQRLKKIS